MTDLLPLIITIIVTAVVGLAVLYFVIKSAVKNALHEDRMLQAKVQQARADQRH
ncbi:DUF6019 family protein [Microbacterium sp. NPDC057650]|uniref:DUF6019 family protein n=1 Tax=unclassified Microbacterium TaxID=2609290 RepID=UPI0036718004